MSKAKDGFDQILERPYLNLTYDDKVRSLQIHDGRLIFILEQLEELAKLINDMRSDNMKAIKYLQKKGRR